jgi:DNA replication protein DnaD
VEPEPLNPPTQAVILSPIKIEESESEDFQDCLTAAEAANRRQQINEESIKDVAKLFKTKIEPHIEQAIKEVREEAFCFPLSPAEIEVLKAYVEKLGYEVTHTSHNSMKVKF